MYKPSSEYPHIIIYYICTAVCWRNVKKKLQAASVEFSLYSFQKLQHTLFKTIYLSTPVVVNSKPELYYIQSYVLIERIEYHLNIKKICNETN